MQDPHELHWKASKKILKYVQATTTYEIQYVAGYALDLMGLTYFDRVGDNIDRKLTSEYMLISGS